VAREGDAVVFEKSSHAIGRDLRDRRLRLERFLRSSRGDAHLRGLLHQVDEALTRLEEGTYGVCLECGDRIEPDLLLADPVACFCLDHLTPNQQRALQDDLDLSARVQRQLLPPSPLRGRGWEAAHRYRPASVVSGDYCDLLDGEDGLYFVVGDVSGKGIAAAMLMSHLHASFRSLAAQRLPLEAILARANRMFCESTLSTHFATLACGVAGADGRVTLASAGHPAILIDRAGGLEEVEATGLPLGMFCGSQYDVRSHRLAPGDTLLLFSDGLPEAVDADGDQYGTRRLRDLLASGRGRPLDGLLDACLADLHAHRGGRPPEDDLTLLALRRTGDA
jgi:sigma-B regulation protein RsbU (phosphoserine phosphatase)